MKPISIFTVITLLLSILIMSCKSYGHDKPSALEGPYVGQNPPGSIPKVFAPSGLSTERRDHSGFFTPDLKEFYFTRRNNKDGKWSLMTFKLKNNRWRESVVGPRMGRPIVTPDGKIMHLGKHYKERTESGWSEQKSLELHILMHRDHLIPSKPIT